MMDDLESLARPYWDLHLGVGPSLAVISAGMMSDFIRSIHAWDIIGWVATSDVATTTIFDIYMDSEANVIINNAWPSSANSICGSAKPSLTATIKNEVNILQGGVLTGWTTYIPAGTWIGVHIDSNDVAQCLGLSLLLRRR